MTPDERASAAVDEIAADLRDRKTERYAQVAFAFRAKANEFHGWVARDPNSENAKAWATSAAYFDALADKLRDADPNSMVA